MNVLLLSENQISDLTPLAGLTHLIALSLNQNQVADLAPLSGLTLLSDLSLEKNQITDLSALAGMNKLKHLYLADNQVRDLSALKGMDSLQTLDLTGNPLEQAQVEALRGRYQNARSSFDRRSKAVVGRAAGSAGGGAVCDRFPLARVWGGCAPIGRFCRAAMGRAGAGFGNGMWNPAPFWCREGKLAHATGLEIQQAGHDQFRRSILLNRLEGRLCAACGDLRDWRPSAAEKLFDLVTVNPPYFPLRAGAACAQEPFSRSAARGAMHAFRCGAGGRSINALWGPVLPLPQAGAAMRCDV